MCNLSQGILERGIEQGIERGIEQGKYAARLENLVALMRNVSFTAEQALAAVGVPDAEWPRYLDQLAGSAPQP